MRPWAWPNPLSHAMQNVTPSPFVWQPWFLFASMGLSVAFLKMCAAFYRAIAFKNSYAGKKADKTPWKAKSELRFECGNYHPLAKWFIAEHNLMSIVSVMSLAIVVALAISTGSYALDEMIITGKNGGMPLDPSRSDALFTIETTLPRMPFGPETPLLYVFESF